MMEIIPALDIIDGKVVRLSQGNYNQKKIYSEDPLEVALMLEDRCIRRIHIVDLDGAKANRIINYKVLQKIMFRTSLIIDFGGGLNSDSDLKIAFDSGAEMVTGGSIAVKDPETFQRWIDKFGAKRIILGADCKDKKIAVNGWTETTNEEVIPFIEKWRRRGIRQVICTDISRDGMLTGPNAELYREIWESDTEIRLIASGGVSSIEDIERLKRTHVSGVIIGRAIYEGKISLDDLMRFY